MELVALTEEIVKTLVQDPESISVKQFAENEDNEVIIQVMVAESDMGRIIGKAGKVANAIRTLVQASSYLKDNKKVRVNIDSF
ncbi:MAG: KH domain-containing protein [Bacilli bacterium]